MSTQIIIMMPITNRRLIVEGGRPFSFFFFYSEFFKMADILQYDFRSSITAPLMFVLFSLEKHQESKL